MQCPGPILRLKCELETVKAGEAVCITACDPGFPADIAGWCRSTNNRLAEIIPSNGAYRATVIRNEKQACPASAPAMEKKNTTIVVFSNDFDKAMAAFIIANGAAAMGGAVTLFFTFWGLNILRKTQAPAVNKNLVEKMFGRMMPRGAEKLTLSKMNMAGMGTAMMKGIMKRKNAASLPDLIQSALKQGVRMVACSMSMDLMGIKREELIAWLQSEQGEWINADIKVSQGGKWYAAVDDWKPSDGGGQQSRSRRQGGHDQRSELRGNNPPRDALGRDQTPDFDELDDLPF